MGPLVENGIGIAFAFLEMAEALGQKAFHGSQGLQVVRDTQIIK